jgi:hypothetical protein
LDWLRTKLEEASTLSARGLFFVLDIEQLTQSAHWRMARQGLGEQLEKEVEQQDHHERDAHQPQKNASHNLSP